MTYYEVGFSFSKIVLYRSPNRARCEIYVKKLEGLNKGLTGEPLNLKIYKRSL